MDTDDWSPPASPKFMSTHTKMKNYEESMDDLDTGDHLVDEISYLKCGHKEFSYLLKNFISTQKSFNEYDISDIMLLLRARLTLLKAKQMPTSYLNDFDQFSIVDIRRDISAILQEIRSFSEKSTIMDAALVGQLSSELRIILHQLGQLTECVVRNEIVDRNQLFHCHLEVIASSLVFLGNLYNKEGLLTVVNEAFGLDCTKQSAFTVLLDLVFENLIALESMWLEESTVGSKGCPCVKFLWGLLFHFLEEKKTSCFRNAHSILIKMMKTEKAKPVLEFDSLEGLRPQRPVTRDPHRLYWTYLKKVVRIHKEYRDVMRKEVTHTTLRQYSVIQWLLQQSFSKDLSEERLRLYMESLNVVVSQWGPCDNELEFIGTYFIKRINGAFALRNEGIPSYFGRDFPSVKKWKDSISSDTTAPKSSFQYFVSILCQHSPTSSLVALKDVSLISLGKAGLFHFFTIMAQLILSWDPSSLNLLVNFINKRVDSCNLEDMEFSRSLAVLQGLLMLTLFDVAITAPAKAFLTRLLSSKSSGTIRSTSQEQEIYSTMKMFLVDNKVPILTFPFPVVLDLLTSARQDEDLVIWFGEFEDFITEILNEKNSLSKKQRELLHFITGDFTNWFLVTRISGSNLDEASSRLACKLLHLSTIREYQDSDLPKIMSTIFCHFAFDIDLSDNVRIHFLRSIYFSITDTVWTNLLTSHEHMTWKLLIGWLILLLLTAEVEDALPLDAPIKLTKLPNSVGPLVSADMEVIMQRLRCRFNDATTFSERMTFKETVSLHLAPLVQLLINSDSPSANRWNTAGLLVCHCAPFLYTQASNQTSLLCMLIDKLLLPPKRCLPTTNQEIRLNNLHLFIAGFSSLNYEQDAFINRTIGSLFRMYYQQLTASSDLVKCIVKAPTIVYRSYLLNRMLSEVSPTADLWTIAEGSKTSPALKFLHLITMLQQHTSCVDQRLRDASAVVPHLLSILCRLDEEPTSIIVRVKGKYEELTKVYLTSWNASQNVTLKEAFTKDFLRNMTLTNLLSDKRKAIVHIVGTICKGFPVDQI